MIEKAYQLLHDVNRLSYLPSGDAYDLKAFDFSTASELWKTHSEKTLELPETTFFYLYSQLKYIEKLDSLYAHAVQSIFSQKIIATLLSVKKFNYRKYKIAILKEGNIKFQDNPDGYKMPEPYLHPNDFKKETIRDDMYIFQTLEILAGVFDWNNSTFRQSDFNKKHNQPGIISEYVLNEPDGGFPPIFRLQESPVPLFVSSEAREVLKEAGITGLGFLSLQGYKIGSQLQIDVPIS